MTIRAIPIRLRRGPDPTYGEKKNRIQLKILPWIQTGGFINTHL